MADTIQLTISDFVWLMNPPVLFGDWYEWLNIIMVMALMWLFLSLLSCGLRAFRGKLQRTAPIRRQMEDDFS